MLQEYAHHDGTALAELIQRRETSPKALLEVAIERAEALAPKLNAVVWPMYDIARKRAAGPLDGPFAGVPFLVKDLFQDYAGVPCAMGNKALKQAA
ncbi:MAG: amidase, partial [Sinobacteraceae bacterium]|nr:amidase [Nevskiaceae bacterium]